MTTNKTLDPATCSSTDEAFKYPLPQVRQFHRSLTTELDEKNGRLRTLVGGSYRQLLGTAETILQMRDNIEVVEEKLGKVGKGCGKGVLVDMVRGLGQLKAHEKEGKAAETVGAMARMKVLDMCTITVGKLLRRRGHQETEGVRGKNLVLAAKVWVLSRLLAKSLNLWGQRDLMEESRKKLEGLRRRILKAIERTLDRPSQNDNREDLIQALCAYSLATSSGAKDVLKHFLRARAKAITLASGDDEESKSETPGVLQSLDLYTKTLLDVQTLVPRRLTEALANLKTKPLLKDPALRSMEGLRLDTCERWFGDEILFFTPYVRHDDLEGAQTIESLNIWAKKASEVLLQGFSVSLQKVVDMKTVVALRTKILEVWIKEGGKAKGFDPTVLLNGFREVVSTRLVDLLETRVAKLHLVGTEVEATLGAWQSGVTDTHESLWSEDLLQMEIGSGAINFKQAVLARTYGRSSAESRAVKSYETWEHLVAEIVTIVAQLRKQRWDDDLEDIEDEAILESRASLLNKDDPQLLQDCLDKSLEKGFLELDARLTSLVELHKNNKHSGKIAVYFLRVLRDIRNELPKNDLLQSFGLALVPSLQRTIAATVSETALASFAKSFSKKKVAGRVLWEGDPELPAQPSPATYKFLRAMALAMADTGCDLWGPSAVIVLKSHLRSELGREWDLALTAKEQGVSDEPVEQLTTKNEDADAVGEDQVSSEAAHKIDTEQTHGQTQGLDAAETPEDEVKDVDAVGEGGVDSEAMRDPENFQTDDQTQGADAAEAAEDIAASAAAEKPPGTESRTQDTEVDNGIHRDVLIQSMFDIFVLQQALDQCLHQDDLQRLGSRVELQLELDAPSKDRLLSNATQYWERTRLLFGLLA